MLISKTVDIVVPVYLGRDETLSCIKSVLSSINKTSFNLIIINDKSPDTDLVEDLNKLNSISNVFILHNSINLGFVGTVNRGMKHSDINDIILLNSDTIVPNGWLDSIMSAASYDNLIATITPFSNRATICSLPRTLYDNEMPLGLDVNFVNKVCQDSNKGIVIDIPTAVGFCMYIRREAIDQLGFFDEARWGKGYGEENDFSIKAATFGWRNVCLCDTFVQHHGSVSFQGTKSERVATNSLLLNEMYPDYPASIDAFILADPLSPYRNTINIEIYSQFYQNHILHITHSWGGGIETFLEDKHRKNIHKNQGLLVLMTKANRIVVKLMGKTEILDYPLDIDLDKIIDDLSSFNIKEIHFHHFAGLPKSLLRLPNILNIKYFYTIHDYITLCPRSNLIDYNGNYCGAPINTSYCISCLDSYINPIPIEIDRQLNEYGGIESWRSIFSNFLDNAEKIFSPSTDAANRISRKFGIEKIEITPHDTKKPFIHYSAGKERSVVLLGAIGAEKGFFNLLQIIEYASNKNSDLIFNIIGYTKNDKILYKYKNVNIIGPYDRDDIPMIIKHTGSTVALFLSKCPETYSYTLSEALYNQLYPVVLDIGAQPERLRDIDFGCIIPIDYSPAEIVSLLELLTTVLVNSKK